MGGGRGGRGWGAVKMEGKKKNHKKYREERHRKRKNEKKVRMIVRQKQRKKHSYLKKHRKPDKSQTFVNFV